MDAAQALADLTEISSQIQAAVIVDSDGGVLASTLSDESRAERVARAAHELLETAGRVAPAEGDGKPLVQLQAATLEGSIFVVRDGARMITATTSPEPTVGLVFYDLKSCLRAVSAEDGDEKAKRPAQRRRPAAEEERDAAP